MEDVSQAEAILTSAHYVHSIWIVMLVIGLMGGALSWLKDCSEEDSVTEHIISHMITGVLAVFMVPLFLQMIGSTLLKNLSPEHHQFFVFIGFCSAAGFIAHSFASRVSNKMWEDTQAKAQGADRKAEKALEKSETSYVEMLKTRCGVLFSSEDYDRALVFLEEFLAAVPDDVSMLWKKAYIVKRRGDIEQAYNLIDRAVQQSDKAIALLFYNRACYAALLKKPTEIIISDLDKVFSIESKEKSISYIQADLGEDLKPILDRIEFVDYLKSKGVQID
ncbi:YEATS-associated helix-containing protein [Alteromonas naphthalenivorans]|uniref:YEATS-Like-Associating Three TM domain-containing protein n=1 Tax=Alteromonas naphthalenivorans TaxID=715451 RepID=F5Z6X1_ALTNA|nr:YEATS-associated helix-containing protein [Alteromonas naphthalenivorans]AEF05634.1 hypothetical protein ambt_20715 [Alteromonas naphthalenivorans]